MISKRSKGLLAYVFFSACAKWQVFFVCLFVFVLFVCLFVFSGQTIYFSMKPLSHRWPLFYLKIGLDILVGRVFAKCVIFDEFFLWFTYRLSKYFSPHKKYKIHFRIMSSYGRTSMWPDKRSITVLMSWHAHTTIVHIKMFFTDESKPICEY